MRAEARNVELMAEEAVKEDTNEANVEKTSNATGKLVIQQTRKHLVKLLKKQITKKRILKIWMMNFVLT